MQFTTISSLGQVDDGQNKYVRYTGTVQELAYTTQKHISQYIPITRFRNLEGPMEPSSTGVVYRVSQTIFAFPFDRQSIEVVGVVLQSPSSWAAAEAGL